ncbi:hypothetical protein JJB99_31960 [Bradyrhizobium diazoefficiens]|uniref:hypothetical protein n=1 Tax=Bradyrhizobium diazoefficiens TaxID=1355477 RepID=UPI00190C9950|nr:hypothetical protein [Bradyrhizobium diazoefficiens]QQO13905.1 hypothetical protein JJB99_31960 [Bradyrhizobium diazoefficiens]
MLSQTFTALSLGAGKTHHRYRPDEFPDAEKTADGAVALPLSYGFEFIMETMAGASINIGMRAAIYEKPLEPDRGHAVRERPCGAPSTSRSRSRRRLS